MSKRRTPDDWQQIFQQFHDSELTVTAFCQQHKLTLSNFYHWRKKITTLPSTQSVIASKVSGGSDNWQAIQLPKIGSPDTSWDIELQLPGGVTLNMRATS